jgi:hypothetical protein
VPTGKIKGFRKFDKVRYQGQEYFIKGRMSTGYAILMDMHGNKVELKPIPKFEQMKRVSARPSWMMEQRTLPGFALPGDPLNVEEEQWQCIHETEDAYGFLATLL